MGSEPGVFVGQMPYDWLLAPAIATATPLALAGTGRPTPRQ